MAKRILTTIAVLLVLLGGVWIFFPDLLSGPEPSGYGPPARPPYYQEPVYQDLRSKLAAVVNGNSVDNPFIEFESASGKEGTDQPAQVSVSRLRWAVGRQSEHPAASQWTVQVSSSSGPKAPVDQFCLTVRTSINTETIRCRDFKKPDEHMEFISMIRQNGILADDTWKPTPWADDYKKRPEPPRWGIFVGWGPNLLFTAPFTYFIPGKKSYSPTQPEREVMEYARQLKTELEEQPVEETVDLKKEQELKNGNE